MNTMDTILQNEKNFELKLVNLEKCVDKKGEIHIKYCFDILIEGNAIFQAKVNSEDLNSFTWVERATHGLAYYVNKKDRDGKFYTDLHDVVLKRDFPNVPFIMNYNENGWKKINGSWKYVTADGIVGSNVNNVRGNQELHLNILKDMTPLACCQNFYNMENIIKKKDIARFLQIFTCQSVLGTIFEEIGNPIRFLVALVGTTNTMKTSSARVFTQFMNADSVKRDDVTFQSTKGGIETYFSKYRDAILLVDDFMPPDSESEYREMKDKLKMVTRAFGDGVCKSRMGYDPTVRREQIDINGGCLLTAETLPGILSSQSRIIQLNLQKGDVDLAVISQYQNNPLYLPTFLWHYISFFTQNCEVEMNQLQQQISYFRHAYNFSVPRYNVVAAQMIATLNVVCDFFEAVGINCQVMRDEWAQSILRIISANDQAFKDANYENIIAEALLEGISSVGGTKNLSEITNYAQKTVYEDEQFYYVKKNTLWLFYREYCQKYKKPCYLSVKELVRKLSEADMLQIGVDYRGYVETTHKVGQANGNKERYLFIKKGKILELLELQEAA